jgi:ribosomal protein L11 methyltransferase
MTEPPTDSFVIARLAPDQVELAELAFWELGATGIEQRDDTTIVREPTPGEIVLIVAFENEASAAAAARALESDYRVQLHHVPHQNWAVEWRKGFGAQRIGSRILLHPSWEDVEGGPNDIVLEIDPENAFGSGDHETTRLVLELLDGRVRTGQRVLDVGCGSGILSIASVRLGARSAVGVDIEEDAIAVAGRNAELNGVASSVEFSTTPLDEVTGAYDVVVANIETRVLVHMPAALRARMAPGASLVLSGILNRERDELLSAYSEMRLEELVEEGEWCACVFREVES